MRHLICSTVATAILAVALGQGFGQQPVGEIAPHPLDGAFVKRPDGSFTNGLLNDPVFQRAVREASKTYREVEEMYRKNPRIMGASPQRAARARFLEIINGADSDPGIGALPKSGASK